MAASPAQSDVKVPDHVPSDLVFRLGHIVGPEFLSDPYEFYPSLHEKYPPLFYDADTMVGGTWVTIKHADALKALRSSDFTIQNGSIFPRDPEDFFPLIPVEFDPPEHRKYRNILDPMLSPKAVLELSNDIRALANELIDEFIDKGECEFTTDFARPLPVSVFLNLMGLPLDMRDTFVRWVVSLISFAERDKAVQIMAEIREYLSSVIEEKRANPDNGAISRIVHGTVDGEPLGEQEVYGFVFFLFIAGIDTVYAAMNNIWVWLARNPERRREMIAEPENIDSQLEELLRYYGVTFSGRTLVRDLEMNGVQMKAGDRFMCILPACNYDPDVYENPREVDFHRPRKPILTFTGGVHACMGGHLARLEIKIALQEWLRRIPEFDLKPGTQISYLPSGVIGPASVPLVW
ncbi:MAG: cytochrome P450 [Novosphingobium sp.]|nr:cytochrome P450 [Novosphingobium sp.]MCP5404147.1 cytochrome P450 [Novosphingobium sp.]